MSADSNESFDRYAEEYDSALSQGLAVSGENKDYFAHRRIEWLRTHLPRDMTGLNRVMDYGCGTGSSAPLLLDILGAKALIGTDTSAKSLAIAARDHNSQNFQFLNFDEYRPDGELDLVYSNGVFHHIPLSDRAGAVGYIYRAIRPGGLFALWENNPWNPGTRLVMSRIPFDRDAITLTARNARDLLRCGGFEILRTDFLFIFPNFLRGLRGIEPYCAGLPLGAQYQVLCRKPVPSSEN
ncbi:MAG: class I SAM-dependent methyltransferase [Deltaproteobacteria bacterium]|nr:class I SAM-dependent methyltransferase [Deltaproteobacteria bacterium]